MTDQQINSLVYEDLRYSSLALDSGKGLDKSLRGTELLDASINQIITPKGLLTEYKREFSNK